MAAPHGICDRCGFKVRLFRLRKEWSGAVVCPPCFDPRPAETRPPSLRPEGVPLPNAKPEPEPVFRDEGEYGGEDL